MLKCSKNKNFVLGYSDTTPNVAFIKWTHNMPRRIITKENAVDLSIEKWEFFGDLIEDADIASILRFPKGDTCALCMLYVDCQDCIIYRDTGEGDCAKTGYHYLHNLCVEKAPLWKIKKQLKKFIKYLRWIGDK